MKTVNIGEVTLDYDRKGKVTRARFSPTLKIEVAPDKLLELLKEVPVSPNANVIAQQAELVFASWFNQLNEIELADRNKYHITSKVVDCLRYPNQKVKKCVVRFSFEDIVLDNTKKLSHV